MKALDDDVRKVHEAYWDRELQAARGKDVVLVEGDDDRDVVGEKFRQRSRTWETRVRIVVAGGRGQVLRRMKSTFPQAFGLVDRDTWTDDEIAEVRKNKPRLFVTEGWCLENVFFLPTALQHYDPKVVEQLSRERERWVRAGALWWSLQRAREAQQRWQESLGWIYGSPRDDLDLTSEPALVNSLTRLVPDAVCREARLDFAAVAESFNKRLAEVLALQEHVQWQVGVHGKRAFKEVLVPALQDAQGQQGNWYVALASNVGRPAPLDALMAMLFP